MPAMLPSTRKLTLWGVNLILIANILVALVAALHAYFLILEMFLWDKPQGLKVFRNTLEKAEITKVLAANQGLYNGFLVAGLIWGLVHGNPAFAFQIKVFFLLCVIVAGAYVRRPSARASWSCRHYQPQSHWLHCSLPELLG